MYMKSLGLMKYQLRKFFLFVALFSCTFMMAQGTLNWRDIYTVKKKDTVFGIAKKYGISLPDLMDANPEMKLEGYSLKKGDTIFIPYEKGQTKTGQNTVSGTSPQAAVSSNSQVSSKVSQGSVIRVGIMLPLHNNDGDGKRMIEYYRGLLLAVDNLKQQGISVDIHAWNVPVDADIRRTLLEKGASQCNLIFGPLYSNQVAPLASFCKTYGIKLVIPFSITGSEATVNPQVYQVYQSPDVLNRKAVQACLNRFPNGHPVFIDCKDASSDKGAFTQELRQELDKKHIKYGLTSLVTPLNDFVKSFDRTRQNVVILNTGRSPQLNEAIDKLDAMTAKYPGFGISLFGYTEWLIYAPYDLEKFYRYDTYVPTTFYYNPASEKTIELEKAYQGWFGTEMMPAGLPRFGITGYDQAEFFLRGYHQYGKHFTGARGQSSYQPVQTPLRFQRVGKGGYQNDSFQLIHYQYNHTITSIAY
jgi:murein DD-endopeptidase MepM/ murein hydrolase activator NlpD